MASPHGIQLAVHLISSFYGELCSKVCECVLRRGALTLTNIIRFTELTRENVINCLRLLIHQNCVQAFTIQQEGGFGERPKILTQYMAIFDNIIHKVRAPKFLQIVSEELGKDCQEIFQGLIQHGRLSIKDIIARAAETAANSNDHDVQENFIRLLNARFVERCPAPEPFLAQPGDEETSAKKRGAKSAKVVEESLEQRALAAAAPMESMRFLLEMDDVSHEKGEESAESVKPGEKRKQDDLKSNEDVLDANRKKEILWRVNFEEFVHRLRCKACISHEKMRNGDEAGIVLSAMLELSRQQESRQRAEKSAYLSINAIYDEVIKKEGGLGMDFDRTRTALDQLGCQTLSTGMDESYSIDIKGIIGMAQNEEVESLVSKRYGREAYRIFRLLSIGGRFLETDKIADTTFVEKKDTLKILYKLWNDNYLHMETAKTGAARQSEFRLWRINKDQLQKQILDEMYHAVLNLRLRMAHEQDQAKEVLQIPSDKLNGELLKKYQRYRKIRAILESSLMNLDDAVMLFHDF